MVGESENCGAEQERLNNVFGAWLYVTSLAGDEGPGVEFLESLFARGRRPYPADEKRNDPISLADPILRDQARGGRNRNFPGKGRFHFKRDYRRSRFGAGIAVTVQDPDGHAVQLTER
jgi:hypothetical protein